MPFISKIKIGYTTNISESIRVAPHLLLKQRFGFAGLQVIFQEEMYIIQQIRKHKSNVEEHGFIKFMIQR